MATRLKCFDELLGPVFSSLQTVQKKHHAVVVAMRLSFGLNRLLKFDFISKVKNTSVYHFTVHVVLVFRVSIADETYPVVVSQARQIGDYLPRFHLGHNCRHILD